jgi:putative oxidoreductase
MTEQRLAPYGAFTLRVTLGVALLTHSVYLKGIVFTIPGTVQFFQGIGLPGWLAWATLLAETASGTLLILGVGTRAAALLALPFLLGATWAHAGNGWLFTNAGGGFEYPLFWAFALVAQALLGDGAYALKLGTRPILVAEPAE